MNNVTQEQMNDRILYELERREQNPGDICSMLKLKLLDSDADNGVVTFSHTVQRIAANPSGNLHGGIISWLMDSSMGILSRSATGYDKTVTMDIHVSYLRAVHIGDEAVIKAYITHAGRSVINIRSELYAEDKLAATADALFYKVG